MTHVEESFDERIMALCLELARRGEGAVSPNPMVGAVLVKNRRIVSTGFHRRFGGPHAEVECLTAYKGDPATGTLYVNLEPCSYYGKTPPCTELIVRSGIRQVVVAMNDPNPLVSGRGIRRLRRAGVRIRGGVLQGRARELNRWFIRHITTGRPYVHLKVAQTLDGIIAERPGKETRLTARPAQRLVHAWRSRHDAILVGAGTVHADDPFLTVRHVRGRNPDVVVLDVDLTVSPAARAFSQRMKRRIFVVADKEQVRRRTHRVNALEIRGIAVIPFPSSNGEFRMEPLLRHLYRNYQLGNIFVEGGSTVFTSFMREDLVDELSMFVTPRTLGGGVPAFDSQGRRRQQKRRRVLSMDVTTVGPDVLIQSRFA